MISWRYLRPDVNCRQNVPEKYINLYIVYKMKESIMQQLNIHSDRDVHFTRRIYTCFHLKPYMLF